MVEEDLLLDAVWELNEAGKRARANNVRHALGKIADDGGYFDVMVVADELVELESRGRLKRAPGFDWGGVESMPKTRIAYELPRELGNLTNVAATGFQPDAATMSLYEAVV